MLFDSRNPIVREPELLAALDEMNFWTRIMGEHAKFIRGGMDPTEEQIIRTADAFSIRFDRLLSQVRLTVPADITRINILVDTSITETIPLRDFKVRLTGLIEACRVTSELPAALLDHVRREADFFLTMLYRLKGRPVPPREVLGIPDGNTPAALVPRRLIPFTGSGAVEVARDENLFWLRIHMEHGEVLLLIAYRPELQEELYRATAQFEQELERLLAEAANIPLNAQAYRDFGRRIYPVVSRWREFLSDLYRRVVQCEVPSGQLNTPALILDHMAREAQYHLDVLQILDAVLS